MTVKTKAPQHGVKIGHTKHSGGEFSFDPWTLNSDGSISGKWMVLSGQIGTGKSSLTKSMAYRLVQMGHKLAVASDKKGEWTPVVRAAGGAVLQVGPGMDTRINPLDPGVRPTLTVQGKPMNDKQWRMMVRARRMSLLTTLVKILTDSEPDPAAYVAINDALDMAEQVARQQNRAPVIPDIINALDELRATNDSGQANTEPASRVSMTLQRLVSGDLGGMFDGESTVEFDVHAPAVSIDTSSSSGTDKPVSQAINACVGSWMESMVTNSDAGQRVVIYEEDQDTISSEAALARMAEQVKLARAYGLFNVLDMRTGADLAAVGDSGTRVKAMTKSLLADADINVLYRQAPAALRTTSEALELSEQELTILKSLEKGTGLWRTGDLSIEVANDLTAAELPLFRWTGGPGTGSHPDL